MPHHKKKSNNLRLAGVFIAAVLGLIFLSLFLKVIFIIGTSRFDGVHKFNVLVIGKNEKGIISVNPLSRSIAIVEVEKIDKAKVEFLGIPIDGVINVKENYNIENLTTLFLKSELPFGNNIEKLTPIDLLRLALFSRTISANDITIKRIDNEVNDSQLILAIPSIFNDPTIYQENQSIEIINATSVNGLGARFATFISNIGGNPVMVSNSDDVKNRSKLIYYGKETYTVSKLSSYFNIPKEKSKTRHFADVIIIVGKDLLKK